jgi:hypothetical protein
LKFRTTGLMENYMEFSNKSWQAVCGTRKKGKGKYAMQHRAGILLLMGFLLLELTCFGDDRCKIAGKIIDDVKGRSSEVLSLFSLREKAIPILIHEIDSDEKKSSILSAPMNSNIEGPINCYCGIVAAYLIETLLAKTHLVLENPSLGWFWGSHNDDYVYQQGIVKKSNGQLIKASDLSKIQALYLRWWQAHKAMSLEDMRQDWQKGLTPFAHSDFHWQ